MTSAKTDGLFTATDAKNPDHFSPTDWALFGGVSLIWGASFLLIAYSLEGYTPAMVTLLRVGSGALTLWAIRVAMGRKVRIDSSDRRPMVLLALVWVAIPFSLFPIAQQWVNSAVAGLLNGATPVLVAVVSVALVKVTPSWRQMTGVVIGFLGILLIALGSAGEGSSQAKGVVLILAATCCYGVAINIAPPLQSKYGAIVTMSNMLGIATVAVIPFALRDLGGNQPDVAATASVLVLGAIGTGCAYWIMATLVGRVGALRASFITYLVPVVSLALGITLRGDHVAALALVGAPLTFVGALLASRRA